MPHLVRKTLLALVALLLGVLMTPLVVSAQDRTLGADVDTTVIKLPPRDIADVLRVLESARTDKTEFEAAQRIAALPVPAPGADKKLLNAFYYKRSVAFQKLGKINNAAVDMRLAAYDYRSDDSRYEMRDLMEAGVLDAIAGRPFDAIKGFEKALAVAKSLQASGYILSINRLLAIGYGAVGNFESAKLVLDDMDGQISRSWKKLPAEFRAISESNVESARGAYFWQQGQWVESERALRITLRLLKGIYEAAKNSASSINQKEDDGRTLTDGSNTPRYALSQIIIRTMNMADTMLQQRKVVDAEFYAREGLQMALDNFGRNSSFTGQSLAMLSKVVSEQGRRAEAVLLAKAALAANRESGLTDDSWNLALSKKFYATALVGNGQYKEADQMFTDMMAGLAKDPESAKGFRKDDLDWVVAAQNVGKSAESEVMALRMYKQAEATAGKNSARTALIGAMYAVALQRQNKWAQAHAAYKAAMPILIDQTRADAENDTTSIKQQQRMTYLLENYLALLAQVVKTDPSQLQVAAAEAFMVADLAKGSGVQRALTASAARANIKDVQLAQLARKEQDLQRRVNSLSELLIGMLSAPPDQQLPSIQAKVRQDIVSFKAQRDSLKKEIERKFPDYAEMVEPKPASVERTQKLLRADEVLVSWYFGEQEGYVWAITKQGVPQFRAINLGRADVAKQVAALRLALDPGVATIDEIPPFDVAAAYSLYTQLLAPVSDSLKSKRVMLVVPHAELGQLPLSLLVTKPMAQPAKSTVAFEKYKTVPWLIRDIAIAQLPSVTALTALRNMPPGNPNRKNFIGFGDPYFSAAQQKSADRVKSTQLATRGIPLHLRSAPKTAGVSSAELALLPRLPDTKQEIEEIGRVLSADSGDLFLNRQASVKTVMETDLSNRKVVMFATHGLVPGELNGLTQPALALSSPDVTGDSDDGLLTMDKVLSLKLDADWVVLSACNTASGEGQGSEAVSGLGRAFFFAGAKALLVSNWPVDSVAARNLMTDLFTRQQASSNTLRKPEVLRQAMLHQIDQGGVANGNAASYAYAHPLFWAPFMVVGD